MKYRAHSIQVPKKVHFIVILKTFAQKIENQGNEPEKAIKQFFNENNQSFYFLCESKLNFKWFQDFAEYWNI